MIAKSIKTFSLCFFPIEYLNILFEFPTFCCSLVPLFPSSQSDTNTSSSMIVAYISSQYIVQFQLTLFHLYITSPRPPPPKKIHYTTHRWQALRIDSILLTKCNYESITRATNDIGKFSYSSVERILYFLL